MVGEIDLVGIKDDKIDIYEVKCSYRMIKARKQLMKLKKNFPDSINNMFFFCGSSGMIFDISA